MSGKLLDHVGDPYKSIIWSIASGLGDVSSLAGSRTWIPEGLYEIFIAVFDTARRENMISNVVLELSWKRRRSSSGVRHQKRPQGICQHLIDI